MARWNKRDRQQMVDGYLNATGRNMFVPREFLDWLSEQPEHDAYELFFGRTDEELAQIQREAMVRQWAAGLRVTVRYQPAKATTANVVMVEQPLYVSPVSGRKAGGGYVANDGTDPAVQAELQRQAASALDGWLSRFEGVAIAAGVDVAPIKEIAGILGAGVVQRAA